MSRITLAVVAAQHVNSFSIRMVMRHLSVLTPIVPIVHARHRLAEVLVAYRNVTGSQAALSDEMLASLHTPGTICVVGSRASVSAGAMRFCALGYRGSGYPALLTTSVILRFPRSSEGRAK